MIMQAIALLDVLDRDINTFMTAATGAGIFRGGQSFGASFTVSASVTSAVLSGSTTLSPLSSMAIDLARPGLQPSTPQGLTVFGLGGVAERKRE